MSDLREYAESLWRADDLEQTDLEETCRRLKAAQTEIERLRAERDDIEAELKHKMALYKTDRAASATRIERLTAERDAENRGKNEWIDNCKRASAERDEAQAWAESLRHYAKMPKVKFSWEER